MAFDRFIPLSEAAQRMRVSVKQTRAMVNSGKIKGGILPDGEMVVSEDTLPKRKEDLPEYKKYSHLKGVGIWLSKAARKYNIPTTTMYQWYKKKYIESRGSEKNKILLDEADVAYCAEIYHQFGSQGKRLFSADGTPYKPNNGSSSTK